MTSLEVRPIKALTTRQRLHRPPEGHSLTGCNTVNTKSASGFWKTRNIVTPEKGDTPYNTVTMVFTQPVKLKHGNAHSITHLKSDVWSCLGFFLKSPYVCDKAQKAEAAEKAKFRSPGIPPDCG